MKAFENALDESINPDKAKDIRFGGIKIQRCACEIGDIGGVVAVNLPKDQVKLIGPDGATLVGMGGNTRAVVGNAGNMGSALGEASVKAKKPKPMIRYALGRYFAGATGGGNINVVFKPTVTGKKIMRTFAQMNLARKKPKPLRVTYVELILPTDGRGAGGTYAKFAIK